VTGSYSPLRRLVFKKDEIDINICGNAVETSGCKETTMDEKEKDYVRKERMSESF
jgi:HSP20 family molecular chaperone IbpA